MKSLNRLKNQLIKEYITSESINADSYSEMKAMDIFNQFIRACEKDGINLDIEQINLNKIEPKIKRKVIYPVSDCEISLL